MRALRLFVVLALLLAGAVACSSDDSDGTGESDDVSTEGSDDTEAPDTEVPDTDAPDDTDPPDTEPADGDGPDVSGDDQALVDALVAQMRSGDDPEGALSPVYDEYVVCAAEGMVSVLGAERLAELGLTAESIEEGTSTFGDDDFTLQAAGGTREDAELMADATLDCGFIEVMSAAFAESSPESADCFTDSFDSDEFREAFVDSVYSGDETAMDAIYQTILGNCFDLTSVPGSGETVP